MYTVLRSLRRKKPAATVKTSTFANFSDNSPPHHTLNILVCPQKS